MWTRALLKANAKAVLRRSYGRVFLACLVTAVLTGGLNINYNFGATSADPAVDFFYTVGSALPGGDVAALILGTAAVMLGILAAVLLFILGLLVALLFVPVVQVGEARYLLRNRGEDPGFGTLFSAFGNGQYWNVVGVMFWMNLRVFLWSLLLLIPGIIKSYQYRFVPYLLAENPALDAARALEISTAMTDGEKLNIWVLDLSFFGWHLLGTLLFGLGGLFVAPYTHATEAELYSALRAKAIASGAVTEAELAGPSLYD